MNSKIHSRIHLRLKLKPGVLIGPGKIDVLRAVRDTGSISAAGRLQGMSYKRTWELVDRMNHDYKGPLIQTNTGGSQGGGATLTPLGNKVLTLYEKLLDNTAQALAKELGALTRLARDQD
jgi:molybdate transport system regulatory protein